MAGEVDELAVAGEVLYELEGLAEMAVVEVYEGVVKDDEGLGPLKEGVAQRHAHAESDDVGVALAELPDLVGAALLADDGAGRLVHGHA